MILYKIKEICYVLILIRFFFFVKFSTLTIIIFHNLSLIVFILINKNKEVSFSIYLWQFLVVRQIET